MNRKLILLNLILKKNGIQRAEFLKSKNVFFAMGEHCYWHPRKLPSEPYLMNIHNNVVVAADVVFHTHDVMEHMFNYMSRDTYKQYIGSIEIFDNCFIGAGSTILYNVKIGPNAIVAAGSVVTKDVPPGTIDGGNPAKVIGSFEKLMTNRLNTGIPDKNGNRDDVLRYFWGNIE